MGLRAHQFAIPPAHTPAISLSLFVSAALCEMHIVVLPAPLQGHVNPCLALARLLIPEGFTFTFVITQELASKLSPTEEQEGDSPTIQYAAVPLDLPPLSHDGSPFDFRSVRDMVDGMRPGFETLLSKLISSPRGVSFIITDCFVTWGQHIASEFKIPAFSFCTSNGHSFTAILHAQILISKGLIPVTDPDRIVDCVPGLPPMRVGDLPQSIRTYPFVGVDMAKDLQKSAGLIINTIYELEEEPLEVIRSIVPIYTIGPILLMLRGYETSKVEETVGFWTEERECLKWLDTRPASSVLFIAFGSLADMNSDQMIELAEGLEASGQAFLWVIRSKAPLSTLLPEGFTERTKERGLIISWAPQLEVLSHPAVGGFFTHCGWNSLTENLSLGGVPMICLPKLAEQRINKLLLVNKWKVGLELQEEDGIVKRAEVEKVVTQLMQGEVGRELKDKVMELKELVSIAVQEGGSSYSHLEALRHEIKKLGLAP